MSDTSERDARVAMPDVVRFDRARINAEIQRASGGTDPFAAAVRATRMPMVVSNPREPDNPVVFVNDAFCRLTGYARAEIVGRNCRFLQGPETDQKAIARIRAAVKAAQPLEIDIRNHRKDGKPFWNRLLMAPVHDAKGELAYFFASQVDVTLERERLEGLETHNAALTVELAGRLHAQQESEARLRFATEAGRLGIWDLDLETNVMTASAVCKANYGRSPDAPFSHEDVRAAIHPDDRQRERAAMARAIETGVDYEIEYRVMRPDHAIGWVSVRAQVVRGLNGEALRMAGISQDTTERRLAALRLEMSEESLRLATVSAEVGTWDLDVTTNTLTVSDRVKAMFGLEATTPFTMTDFFAGLHPADHDATAYAFGAAMDPRRRALYDIEHRTVGRTDGKIRWVAAKGKGFFDDAGRCIRAVGTAIDISREKAISERLKMSEADLARTAATLDALLAHAPIGFAFFDRLLRCIRLNTVLADLNGVTLDALLGRTIEEILPGPMAVGPVIERVIATRRAVPAFEIDGETAARPGDIRSWLTSVFPVYGANDVIDYFGVTIIDITERRRTEAAVRELNSTLEVKVAERTLERDRAWNNAQDLLAVVGTDGVFRAANPAWTTILGWRPEEVIGRSHLDFNHPEDCAESGKALLFASRDCLRKYETRCRHQDGTFRWIEWVASPEGDLIYASGRHITAEKEAAAELEAAQDLLRQAQKMEAVGQLTGGVAHDFNNLLQVVLGNLEMLQRNLPATERKLTRVAENAMAGAKRAAVLTQRLLAFSRRQPLAPKPIDANELIPGMTDLLNRALGETIALHTALDNDLWLSEADPNQLEGAILNLAVNARDAMPGGGKLTIETANVRLDEAYSHANVEVRPGEYVVISVSDTGSGMDKETLARVFEPFFTTKEVGKGTGLGLAMVYGFVKQSGGHVKLYSELGRGTTVRIYLPKLSGPVEPETVAPVPDQPPVGSEMILVVEDDQEVRAYSVSVLRELGYSVLEACNGPAALQLLQQDAGSHVSLLFTDVVLPGGLTGEDIVREAAAIRPALKVLFTTGYARNAIMHEGRLDRGVELITKPFSYAALAAKVRCVLDGPATVTTQAPITVPRTRFSVANSLATAAVLSFSAGFLDGFTYTGHGRTFASAMTGNMVLLGVNLAHFGPQTIAYVYPLAAFVFGVIAANILGRKSLRAWMMFSPHFVTLLIEIVVLAGVAFLPNGIEDHLLVSIVTVSTAMQNTSFRNIGTRTYNSIIMTGNLQTFSNSLASGLMAGDATALGQVRDLGVVLISFVLGAASGAIATPLYGNHVTLAPAALLAGVAIALVMSRSDESAVRRRS